jgi:hypothetical protein
MLRAAGIHHARGTDDDTGLFNAIEGFGSFYLLDVLQIVEAEGIVVREEVSLQLFVVAFGVGTEDGGGIYREWAVDKNRDSRELTLVFQLV